MQSVGLALAAMIVVISVVTLFAATHSHMPRAVRAIAIVVLAAALATPLFATGRGQAIVNELVSVLWP